MKTAVITGGTRGIGSGLVNDFLNNGWNVVFSGTKDSSVEKALDGMRNMSFRGEYVAVTCDVTIEQDIEALWEKAKGKFGSVDIWVNNAGITNDRMTFNMIPPEIFEKVIDVNVKGLMLATYVVYNRMKEQGHGAIYNMEGLGSNGRKIPGLTPYGTSKCAVRYFTDAFAAEVKDGPVVVGTISPGMVLTDLTLKPLREDPENNRQLIKIYNILANDPGRVTPYLVRKMIENRKHGAKISWLNSWKILSRFMLAPLSQRDIVSKYLD
jgi:NAD(P)-dependent dehydrogenase (short-subunit alcohol dehydrogenase family)